MPDAPSEWKWLGNHGQPIRVWLLTVGFLALTCGLWLFWVTILGVDGVVGGFILRAPAEVLFSPPEIAATVWIFLVGYPVIMFVLAARFIQRRVGFGSIGVRVVMGLGAHTLEWSSLHPASNAQTRGRWAFMTGTAVARRGSVGQLLGQNTLFYISREQAREVFAHHSFPGDRFPSSYWNWLRAVNRS